MRKHRKDYKVRKAKNHLRGDLHFKLDIKVKVEAKFLLEIMLGHTLQLIKILCSVLIMKSRPIWTQEN